MIPGGEKIEGPLAFLPEFGVAVIGGEGAVKKVTSLVCSFIPLVISYMGTEFTSFLPQSSASFCSFNMCKELCWNFDRNRI